MRYLPRSVQRLFARIVLSALSDLSPATRAIVLKRIADELDVYNGEPANAFRKFTRTR